MPFGLKNYYRYTKIDCMLIKRLNSVMRWLKEILKKSGFIVAAYEGLWGMKTYLQCWIDTKVNYYKLSKETKQKILQYKGIHKGERCFIIGSGPSQNVHDLELLKDEVTFGVNSDYLSYDMTEWRATYYVITDVANYIEQVTNGTTLYKGIFCLAGMKDYKYIGIEIPLVLDAKDLFTANTFWNTFFPRIFPQAKFSSDIMERVYAGHTVVYVCIQIAAYMGFSEIYLSGVDCDYTGENAHMPVMDEEVSEQVRRSYMKAGAIMIKQFDALAKILSNYGVEVYNATRGGKLESFPRVELEEVLRKEN